MSGGDRRLLVFGRCPEAGRVKTRLIPHLGAEGAAALYGRLLEDTLALAGGYLRSGAELWLDRTPTAAPCRATLERLGLPLRTQQGTDLGARMHHALGTALREAGRAVLIGSDCPQIDRAALDAAFAALRERDAVFAPAVDGGYALIGLRRVAARLFDRVPWGSAEVMSTTRARLRELGWDWHELAPVRDIDRPNDLAYYQRDNPSFSKISEIMSSHAMA